LSNELLTQVNIEGNFNKLIHCWLGMFLGCWSKVNDKSSILPMSITDASNEEDAQC